MSEPNVKVRSTLTYKQLPFLVYLTHQLRLSTFMIDTTSINIYDRY